MASVLNAVVSQGMITSSKKGLQLFCDTPPEFKTLSVFGDSSRVQQVGRFDSPRLCYAFNKTKMHKKGFC